MGVPNFAFWSARGWVAKQTNTKTYIRANIETTPTPSEPLMNFNIGIQFHKQKNIEIGQIECKKAIKRFKFWYKIHFLIKK